MLEYGFQFIIKRILFYFWIFQCACDVEKGVRVWPFHWYVYLFAIEMQLIPNECCISDRKKFDYCSFWALNSVHCTDSVCILHTFCLFFFVNFYIQFYFALKFAINKITVKKTRTKKFSVTENVRKMSAKIEWLFYCRNAHQHIFFAACWLLMRNVLFINIIDNKNNIHLLLSYRTKQSEKLNFNR